MQAVVNFKPVEQPSPLTEYKKIFPNHTPTCFQQDMLETLVTDLETWKKVLIYWAGNDYRPQSIQKMIEYYDQLRGPKKFEPGREVETTTYEEPEPCGVCQKKYCLTVHY